MKLLGPGDEKAGDFFGNPMYIGDIVIVPVKYGYAKARIKRYTVKGVYLEELIDDGEKNRYMTQGMYFKYLPYTGGDTP